MQPLYHKRRLFLKTLLITGGSGGIGAQIVREFANKGWRVAFSYNSHKKEALDISNETGAVAIKADLLSESETAKFIKEASSQLGHADSIILNAGTAYRGLLSEMPLEKFDELFRLHLSAPTQILKYFLPSMRNLDGGSVVFISSIWAKRASAMEAAYSAVKAGQLRLCEALSKEEGSRGIRFNAICPGPVETNMMAGFSEEEMQNIKYSCALSRLPTAQNIARLAYFLCSDSSDGITGQAITLDCGFTL